MIEDGEEYHKILSAAANDFAVNAEVPGYRPGKAPVELVRNRYEKEIYDRIYDKYAKTFFQDAVYNEHLEPVGEPRLERLEQTGERMVIACTVNVFPEIAVTQYRGLEVPRMRDELTEEEVDALVEEFRDRHRQVVPTDRPAEGDDIVYYSYAVECGGRPIPSGMGTHVSQRLSKEGPFPNLVESMRGKKPGDEYAYEIDLPLDFTRAELAGKHITLYVRIEEVKERRLRELSDAFIHEYNPDCATVAEYRKKNRAEQERVMKLRADEDFEKGIRRKLAENVVGEIPPEMIERQLDAMYENLRAGLRLQGKSLDTFLAESHTTMEELRRISLPVAMEELRVMLATEKIAELENIQILPEELTKAYEKLAGRKKREVAELRNLITDAELIEDLRNKKAWKLVRDTAKSLRGEVKA